MRLTVLWLKGTIAVQCCPQTLYRKGPMATIVRTSSGTWKALIRKTGWPTTSKTFRTKRDADDWARRTEDEMVRGAYVQRASADRMTVADALKRYVAEITPTKRPMTQVAEKRHAVIL